MMQDGHSWLTGARQSLRRVLPWRAYQRFRGDHRGAVQIEFALLVLPFCVLVFAIIEVGVSFTARQMLSYSAEAVARQLQTGQLQANDVTADKLRTLLCSRIQFMVGQGCPELSFNLTSYTTFAAVPVSNLVDAKGLLVKANTVSPGGSSAINQLNVLYRWPIIVDLLQRLNKDNAPDGRMGLFTTITWQNEPFPEG